MWLLLHIVAIPWQAQIAGSCNRVCVVRQGGRVDCAGLRFVDVISDTSAGLATLGRCAIVKRVFKVGRITVDRLFVVLILQILNMTLTAVTEVAGKSVNSLRKTNC